MNLNPLMNIGSLTWKERSYLLGLYFADGNLHEVRMKGRSHRAVTEVRYSLQGDEQEIVDNVAMIFRRACLKPRIYQDLDRYSITISASCTNLTEFYPDKKALLRDEVARRAFFLKNNLLSNFQNRIAFCAGLLDGDGTCRTRLNTQRTKRSGNFACLSMDWSFGQTKYPFLIDFFKEFVDSLAPDSSGIVVGSRPKFTLWFKRAGREVLMWAGIARWSWKARTCIKSLSELREQRDREKAERTKRILGNRIRMADIAKRLGIPYSKLRYWHKCGKLCADFVPEGRGRGYYVVQRGEVKRLIKESERVKRTESEGLRLADVGKMLSIPSGTLYRWHQRGMFRATMVSNGRRYLIVRHYEVDELKKKVMECREKEKTIDDEGATFLEVAKLLRIPRNTLYYWHKSGKLLVKPVHVGYLKRLLIPKDEVERLKEKTQREREDKRGWNKA